MDKKIFDKLSQLNQGSTVKFFAPSLNKECLISPMTPKQHRSVIRTALMSPSLKDVKYKAIATEIVSENTKEPGLTTIDKTFALFALRADLLGNIVELDKQRHNITTILDFNTAVPLELMSRVIKFDCITLNLKLPTLARDASVNNFIIYKTKETATDLSEVVMDLYSYEICKYVESMDVEGSMISFDTLKPEAQLQLIDAIPSKLNQQIINYVKDVRSFEIQATTVDSIVIDASIGLFLNS